MDSVDGSQLAPKQFEWLLASDGMVRRHQWVLRQTGELIQESRERVSKTRSLCEQAEGTVRRVNAIKEQMMAHNNNSRSRSSAADLGDRNTQESARVL